MIISGKRGRQMEESLERVEAGGEAVGDMDPVGFQECDEGRQQVQKETKEAEKRQEQTLGIVQEQSNSLFANVI